MVSVQVGLPSVRTGKGRFPAALLHPGEVLWLRGTGFVVWANALITVQYENGGWNVLPMSAYLGVPRPEVLAWVADSSEMQTWLADQTRPQPVWRPLTRTREETVDMLARTPARDAVASIVAALRVLGCTGPAVAADVLEAANVQLDELQRAEVLDQVTHPDRSGVSGCKTATMEGAGL